MALAAASDSALLAVVNVIGGAPPAEQAVVAQAVGTASAADGNPANEKAKYQKFCSFKGLFQHDILYLSILLWRIQMQLDIEYILSQKFKQ